MPISADTGDGWLIVEDEAIVAFLVEDALTEMGLPILSVANRVSSALELVRQRQPSGAVLDVNLAGERVFPVAAVLADRKVPFLFLTGYGGDGLEAAFAGVSVLEKPFSVEQFQTAVRELMASPPHPGPGLRA